MPTLIKLSPADIDVLHRFAVLTRTFKLSKTHADRTREQMTEMSEKHEVILLAMQTSAGNITAEGLTREELDDLLASIRGQR